jgi:hypothetical protein
LFRGFILGVLLADHGSQNENPFFAAFDEANFETEGSSSEDELNE